MKTSSLTRHFLVGLLAALITLVAAPVNVQAGIGDPYVADATPSVK